MLKIIGFLYISMVVTTLSAATLTVDLNGGADYTDIQSAMDAAADGDTVLVKPGEYVITEPINFNRLRMRGNLVHCERAGYANDCAALVISEAIYVPSFLFVRGNAIAPPVGACGLDQTGYDLPCAEFSGCEQWRYSCVSTEFYSLLLL